MYVLLLEGRLRFRVDALEDSSGGDVSGVDGGSGANGGAASSASSYLVARVTQLERPEADLAAMADDPELRELSAAFRTTVRALVDRCAARSPTQAHACTLLPPLSFPSRTQRAPTRSHAGWRASWASRA
jgi:hypothetical protein